MKNKGGIYKIKNIINGKVYIGSAIYFIKRWSVHKSELKNNKHHSIKLDVLNGIKIIQMQEKKIILKIKNND